MSKENTESDDYDAATTTKIKTTTTQPHFSLPLLSAKRVTGHVILPPVQLHPRLVQSSPSARPPSLTRQASMKGNILEFQPLKHYFLQRKLRNTSFGVTVRVGFGLQPDTQPANNQDEDKTQQQMGKIYKVRESLPNNKHICPYPLDMVAIKLFDREKMEAEEQASTSSSSHKASIELTALSKMAQYYYDNKGKKKNDNDDSQTTAVQEPHFVESSSCIGEDNFTYYAVVPFYGEGTLFQYVVECGTLPETIARHYFKQILKGLQTLRDVGICHRNINLTTIQLHGDNCAITELSSCLILDDNNKNQSCLLPPQWAHGGNPRYIPPEVVLLQDFDGYAADLWAAGVCLWQMVEGIEAPFVWASMEDARYRQLQETKMTKNEGIWNLLQGMLQANPSERWTSLEQIWQQDWMQCTDTRAPSFL